jgi:hypothetical protein
VDKLCCTGYVHDHRPAIQGPPANASASQSTRILSSRCCCADRLRPPRTCKKHVPDCHHVCRCTPVLPGAPTGLLVTPGDSMAQMCWDGVANNACVDQYRWADPATGGLPCKGCGGLNIAEKPHIRTGGITVLEQLGLGLGAVSSKLLAIAHHCLSRSLALPLNALRNRYRTPHDAVFWVPTHSCGAFENMPTLHLALQLLPLLSYLNPLHTGMLPTCASPHAGQQGVCNSEQRLQGCLLTRATADLTGGLCQHNTPHQWAAVHVLR